MSRRPPSFFMYPSERKSAADQALFEETRLPTKLQRSAVDLTILCGPPGSGKSFWLAQMQASAANIICLDRIMSEISGEPEHHTPSWALADALLVRNKRLAALATARTNDSCFFVVSSPRKEERHHWAKMLGARLLTFATPLEICERRIQADRTRPASEHARMVDAASKWWALNRHLEDRAPEDWILHEHDFRQSDTSST